MKARSLGDRCDPEKCKMSKKQCYQVSEENRRSLFDFFNDIANLHSQREFLARHLKVTDTRRKTTKKDTSRRLNTIIYTLTINKKPVVVCKKLFLSTFGISERMCRTALVKLNEVGVMEKDKRGGRQRSKETKKMEESMRFKIKEHINRFPKVESHFCRAKTSKMYLHPDLTLHKMFFMFLDDLQSLGSKLKCSYHTYRRVFKEQNLSFLSPKKDQCSLCLTYLEGDAQAKENLKIRYDSHITEKTAARQKKQNANSKQYKIKKYCAVSLIYNKSSTSQYQKKAQFFINPDCQILISRFMM